MAVERNWKIGIIMFISGVFMLIGGYVNNQVTSTIIGILFLLSGINLTSMKYISMESKARIFMDIGIMMLSIAITIHGYILTGSLLLMIMLILLVTLPIIMFIITRLIHVTLACPFRR